MEINQFGQNPLLQIPPELLPIIFEYVFQGLQNIATVRSLSTTFDTMFKTIAAKHYFNNINANQLRRYMMSDSSVLYDTTTILEECPLLVDARLAKFTKLRKLVIGKQTCITDHSLKQLTNLTYLDVTLRLIQITDDSIKKLLQLRSLNIENNYFITDDTLTVLTNLTSLNIRRNYSFTNRGVSVLTNLTTLNLNDEGLITDVALIHLTKITNLGLGNNFGITNKGIKHLNLRTLSLSTHSTCRLTSTMTTLRILGIVGPVDLTFVEKMIGLKYLTVKHNSQFTTKTVSLLTNLKQLTIAACGNFDSAVQLTHLTNLKNINKI